MGSYIKNCDSALPPLILATEKEVHISSISPTDYESMGNIRQERKHDLDFSRTDMARGNPPEDLTPCSFLHTET